MKSKESRDRGIRFITTVEKVWNRQNPDFRVKKLGINEMETPSIWVQKDLVDCQCIDFDFGRSYLVMANIKTTEFMGKNELELTQADVIEEWDDEWDDLFARFNKLDSSNKCDKFNRLKRHTPRRNLVNPNYYPPSYNQYASYN